MTQGSPRDPQGNGLEQPLLVCLLPARNAAADLPEYLENVSTFCDAIVALDDGSTDGTHEILAAHPLVKVLGRNPRREDYRGWDDAANRNWVLTAAAELDPLWYISLDADERIDERDATALREFLQTDALPGFAYGFRHVPMRGDAEHFLPSYEWVYRVFGAAPNQRFRQQRLHFIPVPTDIPRYRWIKTTLRIQHLGGLTTERRLARFAKYLEADPHRTYRTNFAEILAAPAREDLRRWQPRPESVPVLLESGDIDELDDMRETGDAGVPSLSAIIIAQNNEATIAQTVISVVSQEVPEPFEVIVVTSGTDRTAAIVREQFPEVTLVELPKPALPGEARNAGLAVARGRFVTFPGSHIELSPGSLAARLRAHRRGYAMVTGVVTNGTPTPAGWASYFLDQSENLPGHRAAEYNGPPAHCSYARLPLLEVGGFPEGVRTAEDTAANRALVKRGYVAYRDPDVQFIHRSRCTTIPKLVRHHFRRGRGWGRMLVTEYRKRGHLLNRDLIRAHLVRSIPDRLNRIHRSVQLARPDIAAEYRRHRGLVALGAVTSWAGMWYEIVKPAPGKAAILWGRPFLHVLVAGGVREYELALVQMDGAEGETTLRPVPPDLEVPHEGELVPLADLLMTGSNGAEALPLGMVRDIVGAAVNIELLECIVDPKLTLPVRADHNSGPMPRPPAWANHLYQIVGAVTTVWRLRRGSLRSTLGPWDTARVRERIRVSGGA